MRKSLICLFLLLCSPAWGADIPVPVATDSRIKTFVYSENDVFNLVTHYGYQSNIEFGLNEQVEQISLGERASWQVVPSGRRIFIRALVTNAHTNMTVITNKHAYQFDLTAVPAPTSPNEELAYVVRFFYPGDKKNAVPAVYTDDVRSGGPMASPASMAPAAPANNYSYTYSGADTLTPVKIYDDGSSTYVKFRDSSVSPSISVVGQDGKETPVSARRSGEFWVVDAIAPKLTIRQGDATVYVYNEKLSHS